MASPLGPPPAGAPVPSAGAPPGAPPAAATPPGLAGPGFTGGGPVPLLNPPQDALPTFVMPPRPAARPRKIPKELDVKNQAHLDYVQKIIDSDNVFKESSMTVWKRTVDWWDLFLARQPDTRDPVDELWRSDAFVPLPFSTTRTKAAQMTELIGNTGDTVWQVEATRETGRWYQQARQIELELDYVHRMNRWRKFLLKFATGRSVQGTAYLKIVNTRRSHIVDLRATEEDYSDFESAIQQAMTMGAPQPPDPVADPEQFEKWRKLVNKTERFPQIPTYPEDGEKEIVEYEGPVFQYIPMWAVRLDPTVDELENQSVIIHRMVKPMQYVLDRSDDDPNSDKPFYLKNVKAAGDNWDGSVLLKEEQALAEATGLNPLKENHPMYRKSVKLWEVWSPDDPFKYSVILNERYVINKRPLEFPLLTRSPNILAARNVVVPGNWYGLSDYQECEKLFKELNTFRRLRMDGATLTTLPAFVKASGFSFTEAMKKIRPGMIITANTASSIQSLIRHTLPPEAYREPQEMKLEIEEATEVTAPSKGASATVGRVTGVEFQGRAASTSLKFKIDAGFIEDELASMPPVILSFLVQMGNGKRLRHEIGGDPDALVDMPRSQLIQAIGMRFRLRGATKHLNPDLQVQQLTTLLKQFDPVLTATEKRFAMQTALELLELRGTSKILSDQGASAIEAQEQMARQSAMQQQALAGQQAQQGAVPLPGPVQQPPQPAGPPQGGQK